MGVEGGRGYFSKQAFSYFDRGLPAIVPKADTDTFTRQGVEIRRERFAYGVPRILINFALS